MSYQQRWPIGTDGDRESWESLLSARLDDDDDDGNHDEGDDDDDLYIVWMLDIM